MINSGIYELIKSDSLGKGEKKKHAIIMATINLVANEGFENCTFDRIAKEIQSTRPLLNHYFKTRESLFISCAQVVRLKRQEKVVTELKNATSNSELLLNYIKANFNWYDEDKNELKYYVQFLALSTSNEAYREKNQSNVEMGLARILQIVSAGMKSKDFKKNNYLSNLEIARSIQLLITGALISLVTENKPKPQLEKSSVLKNIKFLLDF